MSGHHGRRFAPSRAEVEAGQGTDPARLATLAEHRSGFVRSAVARNPHAGADTLTLLAADADEWVRHAVARHPNTTTAVLAALGTDTESLVRAAVARNPNTPPATLTGLAADDAAHVRTDAARNPSLPVEMLRTLAEDPEDTVRALVAKHPATPDEVVLRLLHDDNQHVSEAAMDRGFDPNAPKEWRRVRRFNGRRTETVTVPHYIEQGGRFSPVLLTALAEHPVARARKRAAAQPDLPVELMARLAGDRDPWVQVTLAENPEVPDAVLSALVQWGEAEVLQQTARHRNLSAATAAKIAATRFTSAHEVLATRTDLFAALLAWPEPVVRRNLAKQCDFDDAETLDRLVADPDSAVAAAAAKVALASLLPRWAASPHVAVRKVVAERTNEPRVLADLATDPSVAVRRSVAGNRHVPAEALTVLVADRDATVVERASARFLDALNA